MANEFHLKRIEVMPRTDLKEVGDRLLAPLRDALDEHARLVRDDRVRRSEYMSLAAEMSDGNDEYVPGPNCDDRPCDECRDDECPCSCHQRHEYTDLPENNYPSFTDAGIDPKER